MESPRPVPLPMPFVEKNGSVARLSVSASMPQPVSAIEISASDIRARCLTGKPIRYLVPDAVDTYIAKHKLYT